MNEPQDHSSGDSPASGSRLTQRLAERASGKSGVVDTEHPRALYDRTAGWIAHRLPLLARLKTRYAAGDEGYQQGQPPLIMGRALSTTGEAAPEFAQTVPSRAGISRKGEDSLSQSQSPGSSPTPPVTYRVSRRPSYQALTIDRTTRGGDSLASSAQVEPDDSIKESGPQPILAPDADMSALRVALPLAAGDRESEEPIGRPEANAVKTGPANSSGNDDSGGSAGSATGASLRIRSETPSLAHKSEPVSFPRQNEVRQVSGSSASGENRQAPQDLVFLKRDDSLASRAEDRDAPPSSVTEGSSTRAVDGTREPREPAADREPPTSAAPIASEMGESVPSPTFGRQSANGTGQPAVVPSRAPGFVAETIAPGRASRSVGPLVLSREALSSASSAASTHAAVSTPSLPLVKPQTSPAVQRKRLESSRAAVPGAGTHSGSLIAREIRAASHQTETPNLVWRRSVSAAHVGGSPAPDTTMMLNASRLNGATSAEGSSSSGSLYNSQSGPAQLPESNQSPSIDLGRITEQIVRAIQRRLEVERERRGMGR